MVDLFWLLLPVAACSGWMANNKSQVAKKSKNHNANIFKFNQKYIKGLNLILDDETDKAVDVFLDLFSVDNDTVETHLALGSLFRKRGEVERALRIHQNVIARPNLCAEQRLNGMLELGHDYLCAGVLDRAENIFKDINKQYPNNSQALKYLLDIYQQQCEWQSAIETALSLQKHTANRYTKNIAHYYCELADKKISCQEYNDSYFYIKQALKYEHNCVRANLLLASINIRSNNAKQGLKIYQDLANNSKKYLDTILPILIKSYTEYHDSKTDKLISFIEEIAANHPEVLTLTEVRDFLLHSRGYNYVWSLLNQSSKNTSKLSFISGLLDLIGKNGFTDQDNYHLLHNYIKKMISGLKKHTCKHCGFSCCELLWLCPSCKNWDTIYHMDFND